MIKNNILRENDDNRISLQAANKTFRIFLIMVKISRVGHRSGIPVSLILDIFQKTIPEHKYQGSQSEEKLH